MLLMVKKLSKEEYVMLFIKIQKLITNTRKFLIQKLLLGYFKWVEHISRFNEDFIKSYNDDKDEGYFQS